MIDFQERKVKYPNKKVTVIIRNDGPMINCGDCSSYRSVSFDLTDEQIQKIALKLISREGNSIYYESISSMFIEMEEERDSV